MITLWKCLEGYLTHLSRATARIYLGQVIVTGSSGFIGRNVVTALQAAGHNVIAWSRNACSQEYWRQQDVRLETGDLSEVGSARMARQGVTAIIHLAGVVAPHSRDEAFGVNVEKTRQIVSQLVHWNTPPRFLYISSLAASGPCVNERPRKETDRCEPRSIYGESKAAAEAMLSTFADRLSVSVVRPPGVFGPWDRNLLSLFNTVRWRLNLVGISKQYRYSFVHVEDLVNGIIAVLNQGASLSGTENNDAEGIYFVSDSQPMGFVELGNMTARAMGLSDPLSITVPAVVCHAVARVAESYGRLSGTSTYLNRDKMREAVAGSWLCDPSRAAQELRFSVAKPLAERIEETVQWYRQQGWLPA